MGLMSSTEPQVIFEDRRFSKPRVWLFLVILLGFYLTLRGYHSRDGDQAYRLPILLHQQSPTMYADDPFVRAFDQFNPHRGALIILDLASRVLGLSGALFALFALTFLMTGVAVDRLARKVWPDSTGHSIGLVIFSLLLLAKAGNIGTNHLFEAMLLDRLQAFALGWVAIATSLEFGTNSVRKALIAPIAIALATWIHPSAGLQLALTLTGSWIVWSLFRRSTGVTWRCAVSNAALLGLAVVPGLLINGSRPGALLDGLSRDDYWTLAVELQSPQHMLPHLWRRPQWLAWGSYFLLTGLAIRGGKTIHVPRLNPARTRLGLMLAIQLIALGAAWVGIEVLEDVRITVFQPFRMATIARGLALVFIGRYVVELWKQKTLVARLRASGIVVGLTSDWLMVVMTVTEFAWRSTEVLQGLQVLPRKAQSIATIGNRLPTLAFALALTFGIRFLTRHDTESGQIPLLVTCGMVGLASWRRWPERLLAWDPWWKQTQLATSLVVSVAWFVPFLAVIAGSLPSDNLLISRPEARALLARCRFTETAQDDVERLALWCRENTPEDARFIGPPGPKTFRLWSRRTLAFNRAASPYHAAGLADWFERFRDHAGYPGTASEFVKSYLGNRHGFESRYDTMTAADRIELAGRQGANYVLVPYSGEAGELMPGNGFELLRVEGKYAVYRLNSTPASSPLAQSQLGRQIQR